MFYALLGGPSDFSVSVIGKVSILSGYCVAKVRPAPHVDTIGLNLPHAVATFNNDAFAHVCGPEQPLPEEGLITVIGPGTGLGVASLLRRDGHVLVIETEGGHVDFAPLDALEDRILAELRRSFRRVSVERLLSGRGLVNIYEALAAIEDRPAVIHDERALWTAAMDGSDSLAAAALERLCLTLGAVAGDLALAQGATAVAIGGGLGLRLAEHLPRSGFRSRFIAKGRGFRAQSAPCALLRYVRLRDAGVFPPTARCLGP